MKKLVIASIFVTLPISAWAADLSDNYVFIEDSVEPLAPSVVGHLELSGGWEHLSFIDQLDQSAENDLGRFEGHGRVNIPFAGNWNLELDTGGAAWFKDGVSASFIGAYGHLWADFSGIRTGIFGGIDFYSGFELATVGLEAEADIGDVTLGIQGNYTALVDCGSCDTWAVTGWADLYVASNTKLGIQGRWADTFLDEDIWSVAGTAEHRFAGSPVSLFVKGSYEALGTTEMMTVLGGLRVLMDDGLTLQEHDHRVPFKYEQPEIYNLLNWYGF